MKVWSVPVRLMHWTLVAGFAVAFYTRDMELSRNIHIYAGYMAGAALALRLVYGALAKNFASFRHIRLNPASAMSYLTGLMQGRARRTLGHNPAGAIMVYAMLSTGILTVGTGYLSFNDMGFLLLDESHMEILHAVLPWIWLAQVALHVGGIVAGSLIHHENLALSMITGHKARHIATQPPLLELLSISLLKGAIVSLDFIARIFGAKRIIIPKQDTLPH